MSITESSMSLARVAELSKQRADCVRVGQLINGLSDWPLKNANLVFDANEIIAIDSDPQRPADLVLDEYTVLPCLIEAHAHLFLDGAPIDFPQREQYLKNSPQWMLERARARWPKILHFGVGAIRDAGDKHNVGLTLAAEIKGTSRISAARASTASASSPEILDVPFIDSPGAAIHHRGRYGSFMGLPIEDHASAAACALARIKAGADRVKLLVSGIINFKEGKVTTPPQLSIDEVREIVQVAKQHGKQTFAHASGAEGVEHSIEGGVTTVEHGFFITDEQLAKMRDRGIAWVPTFAPVQLQIDRAKELGWSDEIVGHLKRIIDGHRRSLVRAHEMGVTIVAGSDAGSCGVPHGLGLLQEMQQMETAGLSAMPVIKSATGTSAATLEFPQKIGRLAPGFRSRFIFTRRDPLATVANLQRERTILFDGAVIECSADHNLDGL
jgi:imidazolonepropionase-like amidohydrolase